MSPETFLALELPQSPMERKEKERVAPVRKESMAKLYVQAPRRASELISGLGLQRMET